MIECCADEVIKSIVDELKKAGMYAIMADEARSQRQEQLAIYIRYVDFQTDQVKESFLGFTSIEAFDANAIQGILENTLTRLKIHNVLCVGQANDGASVMSSDIGGVQRKFKQNHREAIYIHCYAHDLNLLLLETCNAIKTADNFF